ncbi:MAG: divergent polysaccharide deacetylase family protein, partial [Desulfuromonadales bacterium]|nr:divergent polysaccharide deacetylase family protein [Desulfuromonadales bacterium]
LAAETARRYNVPTMERDVFLDNVAEVDAIVMQILKLEAKARKQGMAIGICHPYPETLEALRRELPGLVERGISLVPVSVLLQKQALAQGS